MRALAIRTTLLALSLGAPFSLGAQIIARPTYAKEPGAFFTVGVAYAQFAQVNDGTTGSQWDFSDALQYRASLEKGFSGGASIGVAATTSNVPLSYYANTLACTNGCNANARVSQLFAVLHIGSNRLGAHQVIDVSAGTTMYSEFRAADGTTLPPDSDEDFAFGIGYGFGYNFSPSMQVDVVEDWGLSIHQRAGLPNDQSTSAQFRSTRLTLRLGLGS